MWRTRSHSSDGSFVSLIEALDSVFSEKVDLDHVSRRYAPRLPPLILYLNCRKDALKHWHEFFLDDNVAVPLVDRVIHHSRIFLLGGESYRLKQKLNG